MVMVSSSVWSLLGVAVLVGSALGGDVDVGLPPVQEVQDNHLQEGVRNIHNHAAAAEATDIIKQMLVKRCLHSYSMPCLKLDLARLVDRLSRSHSTIKLLPGVSLSSLNTTSSEDIPADLAHTLARDRSHSSLDDFLIGKVGRYLGSLTLSVRLAEPVDYLASRALAFRQDEASARQGGGKRKGYGGLLAAALLSAGTLLTLGLAALAAMSGKAMMTALAALMLAALTAMKGSGGGDHKSTTYEVITKPVVSHAYSHSSEVQHDHGGHHGYHYGRSIDFHPKDSEMKDTQDSKDAFVLAYRAHQPTVVQRHTTGQDKV